MSASRKPRKQYRPRAVIADPLTIFRQATQAEKDRVMSRFLSSLDTIANGAHPGNEEWRDLSDCINSVETAVLRYAHADPNEVMPSVNAAIKAMVLASKRFRAGNGMRLDAEGLEALRDVVAIYGQLLDGLSAREMARIQAETERRIRAVLRLKNPGEMVVVL